MDEETIDRILDFLLDTINQQRRIIVDLEQQMQLMELIDSKEEEEGK